jgi:hypothetical protein
MATYAAEQVAARGRRPTVTAGVPIVASKITAPGVPGWAVPRPRITTLIARDRRWCPLTVVTRGGRGQDDGAGVVGGGRTRDGGLGHCG